MAKIYNRITNQRVLIWLITLVGILLAPVITYLVCVAGLPLVFITMGLIGIAGWAFLARDRWWVPFPASLALGGTFYYGFKIPIHEMALLICVFPLALALATRWQGGQPGRTHPSASVFLLACFLFFHWIASLIFNTLEGYGGAGTVTRNYMNALWPMILFFLYYFFGNSRYMKEAFFLMYIATVIRVTMTLLLIVFPSFVYIPGINFIPANVMSGGADDLRAGAQTLATLSVCYCCMLKGGFSRGFHFFMFLMCFPILLLGGGRSYTLVLSLVPFYWALIYRKYILLIALVFFGVGALVFLNLNPEIIEPLPPKIQRSLSGFIVKKGQVSVQEDTEISTEYHRLLRNAGFKKWTSSLPSFFVGNIVRPLNMDEFRSGDLEEIIKACDAVTVYECGLWNTLGRFGLIGYILYLNVIRFLLADSLPLLWKRKICDYETAFAFITSFSILNWLLLGAYVGSFPSTEIMMGLFAKTLHDDRLFAESHPELTKTPLGPQYPTFPVRS